MFDAENVVIYVGKARNLKRRVGSYFRAGETAHSKEALIERVRDLQVTVTHTETEALLLEHTLIKQHQPRYNVLLRDDKSYPYIHLADDTDYPRISLHRGARKAPGTYYGPYPSAFAVRESLSMLQKLFKVRQCEDSFFRNRSRPCLQYQIKRCSGPCVDFISTDAYAADVQRTELFLKGRNNDLIQELLQRMEEAAEALAYEEAATLRDQIRSLRHVQERQYVSGESGDLDVVAVAMESGQACVQLFVIRQGRNLGNRTFYPKLPKSPELSELRSAFVGQYYAGKQLPGEILLDGDVEESELIAEALSEQAGRKVRLRWKLRGERKKWVELAQRNAQLALKSRLASHAGVTQRLEAVRAALGLEEVPELICCFDVSHTQGERTVASCVAFGPEGPAKNRYRKFNIDSVTGGDDYGALREALTRHFTRLRSGEARLPDVALIDGGKGQLAVAEEVFRELQVEGVALVGVAKGATRKAGMEQLFLSGQTAPLILPASSPALHLIQQVRDEAHRFAITGHRGRRNKARTTSTLESIRGIGSKRRRELLRHFGGLPGVKRAGVDDLCRVDGISRTLAENIYAEFHPD
jgi:excinuclease ABC subunit C